MNRRNRFILIVGLCFFSAFLLSRLAQLLHGKPHPLVSSLTCMETTNPADLYWKINQIEVVAIPMLDRKRIQINLSNNVPNFDYYLYRLDGHPQWQQSRVDRIYINAANAIHTLELRAVNAFGRELPSSLYTITVRDNSASVVPAADGVERGSENFRFEKAGSKKIVWLKTQVSPVLAGCTNQWDAYLLIRRWVSNQIPQKHPIMKSRWDAQRILEAVRTDATVGFYCDAHAATFVSACASVGLHARMIHLGDEKFNGHYVSEVWSDLHDKWILMDPLYDCHFGVAGMPLSALELHHLWKAGRIGEVEIYGTEGGRVKGNAADHGYANLFQDIQLVSANDFLSSPVTSVLDLLTFRIRFLRYIDETNPPYNRIKLMGQILLFYYLPRFISGLMIPFGIPALLIYMTLRYGRNST